MLQGITVLRRANRRKVTQCGDDDGHWTVMPVTRAWPLRRPRGV
jgi:hypothetical protein